MMRYLFRYFIPGLLVIGLAFVFGAQKSMIFGLLGFLAFFTIGVTIIIEGRRKVREETEQARRQQNEAAQR